MKKVIILFILFALPFFCYAEHDCVEEGYLSDVPKIEWGEDLPLDWWKVGDYDLNSEKLLEKLKIDFPNQFTEGDMGGGEVCFKFGDQYLRIGDQGWGGYAVFNKTKPKCIECDSSTGFTLNDFQTGIGLHLGQTISEVQNIIGKKIKDNEIKIIHESYGKRASHKIYRTQLIHMRFSNSQLVDLFIFDAGEGV